MGNIFRIVGIVFMLRELEVGLFLFIY